MYGFIEAHRHQYSIALLCQTLNVGVSGYFAWRRRPESHHLREDRVLTQQLQVFHDGSRGTYGAPRMKAELADHGLTVSRTRITRLMRQAGLKVRCKRKFRTTTQSKHRHPVAENLLNRAFTAQQPNQKWVTDITYLPVTEGWLYLAVVMDLFSRKIVGWAMRPTLHAEVVLDALQMARHNRQPPAGLLHHSDQRAGPIREEWRAQARPFTTKVPSCPRRAFSTPAVSIGKLWNASRRSRV